MVLLKFVDKEGKGMTIFGWLKIVVSPIGWEATIGALWSFSQWQRKNLV